MARKLLIISFLIFSFALSLMLVSGCGQVSTNITSSHPQPSNMIVRGTVYKWVYSGINTSGPTVGAHFGDPVADVYVTLDGNGSTFTTKTDSRGEYQFVGIPDGRYTLTTTKEGYLDIVPEQTITVGPTLGPSTDNTVYTADPSLYFEDICYITGFSPAPSSEVSNSQVFKVTFSGSMDVSTVRFNLVPQGTRTYSSTGDNVNLEQTWSTDYKTVTITPRGGLSSNEVYRLTLDYSSGPTNYYPLDQKGAPFFTGWTAAGLRNYCQPYADYRTTAGGVPAAPSNLSVAINGTAEVNASDVITGANLIQLSWDPASSGNITGYKIYVARSGSVLNYSTLEASASTSSSTTNCYFTSNISKLVKAIYGTGAAVDPVGTGNYPFINNSVYFKVVAFNGDGESSGATVSATDSVGPRMTAHLLIPWPGAVSPWNVYFPPEGNNVAYVFFNDLVDPSTIATGNFSLDGGLTVTGASLMVNSTSIGLVGAYVKITASGNLIGATLTVTNGVKDLSGNPVRTGTGDTLVL